MIQHVDGYPFDHFLGGEEDPFQLVFTKVAGFSYPYGPRKQTLIFLGSKTPDRKRICTSQTS
jgi:hypothetical protein